MSNLPVDKLNEYLIADFETGKLFWKPRLPSHFTGNFRNTAEQQCRSWNTRYAGKQAFTAQDKDGYFVGAILGNLYKSHRVIWAMKHGHWPKIGIDHDDGNKENNKIWNLKLADQSKNMKNSSMRKDNQSGVMGVYWDASKRKWAARININKKPKFIGRFDKKDEAIAARKLAERNNDYHPNHGRRKSA